jgi:hypothetical protein
MEVVRGLSKHLVNQGVISSKVSSNIQSIVAETELTMIKVLDYLGEQFKRR